MSSRRPRLFRPGVRRPRVYLHIGAMKTGTTFLQDLMSANRKALAEAGFLFPGERWADQSRAVRDVLGFSTEDPRAEAETAGMWDRISTEMLAHQGSASILSMEFLSFADAEQARRVVESLGDAEVHVILTVRDAAATIPAQWQTTCRNGGKVPLRKFVQGIGHVLSDDDGGHGRARRMFQRTQGVVRMLDVWVPLVGPERVHVITVPPRGSDPDLLWRRFAGVVGVDPDACPDRTVDSNPSLGLASTELLRLVNLELGKVSYIDYTRTVKRQLARFVLGSRASLEPRVRLNRRGHRLAARWNERVRAGIERHGLPLVGSLDELPVAPPAIEVPKALPSPSAEELLAAAATAVDGMRCWSERLERALEEGTRGDALTVPATDLELPDVDDATAADRWAGEPEPVQAAVREVADVVRTCMRLRNEVERLEPTPASTVPASSSASTSG